MSINLKNKAEIIEKFGKDGKDTGSAEVQIALLSQKINELTEHLKANQKDFQGRRGLLMMVGQRKQLLAYLKNKNLDSYRDILKKLNIRG
ncbi:MAG: 30S ribosomal protein S15 [Candidatus Gastranaerophilales bacterium]|nr:30S ribosomal protein S15 [Candidatus Gastranaerophilales bacterium]